MATSLHEAQFALKLCEIHQNKELHAYCKSCKKKICSSCIKDKHNLHDWETITDILRAKRRRLPKKCRKIRVNTLPDLREKIYKLERKIEEEDIRLEQNKSILKESRQILIGNINLLFDARLLECKEKSKAIRKKYEQEREGLQQKVKYLDMITTSLDKDINTLPDHDILDMEMEMSKTLKNVLSYRSDKYTCTTVFVPRKNNVQVLRKIIGEIHSVSLEEKNDIDRYFDTIMSLRPINNTYAWISIGNCLLANMIDKSGEKKKSIRTPSVDFAILNSGQFVFSNENNGTISVLSQNGDYVRTIDTKPLRPIWITETENGDILVSMTDYGDPYNLFSTSRRLVQRMTLQGRVLHTYEFKEDDKTKLFTSAVRSAENKNSDICVINRLNEEYGELIVLFKDGRVKFTYKGEGLKSKMFLPYDVECDPKRHILLTEKHTRAIHMLNAEGIFLFTLYQSHLCPFVISLHKRFLWCGFAEGRVKVFEYEN